MEAKLKDGSILYVDAEERIYAQGIPGGPFPLVIDHVEGERLLIEFAEQQQQEIEALTNLKKTLEEANHGMQEKIQEQEQKIEMLLKENNVIYAKFLTIDHFIEEARREVKKL